MDGYIDHDEAYLCVEIFWTDSQDLSLYVRLNNE